MFIFEFIFDLILTSSFFCVLGFLQPIGVLIGIGYSIAMKDEVWENVVLGLKHAVVIGFGIIYILISV